MLFADKETLMQKNSRSEAERAFDCHILTVTKLIFQGGNTDKENSFKYPIHLARGPLGF